MKRWEEINHQPSQNQVGLPLQKGDTQQPLNYRCIKLTSIASNVYKSLLLNRITKHLAPILRRNQKWFS